MRVVLFAALLVMLSVMAVSSEGGVAEPPVVGVAVFLCNEWQGVSVYDGSWHHYSTWRIVDSPALQDLLRGVELEEIRLGSRDFCIAFKAT